MTHPRHRISVRAAAGQLNGSSPAGLRGCASAARLVSRTAAASVGIFAGMTLAEISVLAQRHHMSYGKYRALAEAQGRLDVQT